MTITNLLVPQLSESISEATLLIWKKASGSAVEADEILVEIETDKIVLEVRAPVSGILTKIIKGNNSLVTSGEVISYINSDLSINSGLSNTCIINESIAPVEVIASPSASKMLIDNNIPLGKLPVNPETIELPPKPADIATNRDALIKWKKQAKPIYYQQIKLKSKFK